MRKNIKSLFSTILTVILISCGSDSQNTSINNSSISLPSASTLQVNVKKTFCADPNCVNIYDKDSFPAFKLIYYELLFTVTNTSTANRSLSVVIKIPNSEDIRIRAKDFQGPNPVISPPTPEKDRLSDKLVLTTTINGISYTAQPGTNTFYYVWELVGLNETTPDDSLESSYIIINDGVTEKTETKTFRFVGKLAPLAKPLISLQGDEIIWNPSVVDNPTYDVYLNDELKREKTPINKISISDLDGGNHKVVVMARGDRSNFTNSEPTNFNFAKLFSPTIINSRSENKKTITWESISGANQYELFNGLNKFAINTTSVLLDEVIELPGTYQVDIRAISALATVAQSKPSNRLTVIKLASPVIEKLNAGTISWPAVPNATGYIVLNNSFISEPITTLQYNLLSGPNSNVQVIAISSENNVLDSGLSNIINYDLG